MRTDDGARDADAIPFTYDTPIGIEGSELDLLAAMDDHEALIEERHRWTYGQFEEAHGQDIEGYDAELAERNTVVRGDPKGPRPQPH